jgi:hypothetical protein
MLIVFGLTAQAEIVRMLEKVVLPLQSSKCPKDLANPPSDVAGGCIPYKEHSCSYLYKLHSHIGMQVG